MTQAIDAVLSEGLLERLTFELSRMTQTSERLATGSINNILETGTVILPAALPQVTKSFQATVGGVEIRNPNDSMIVVQGTPGGSAPIQGAGVHYVEPWSWRTVNVASRSFTIFGTAGAAVGFQAFSTGLVPAGGLIGQPAWTTGSFSGTGPTIPAVIQPVTAVGAGVRRFGGYTVRETAGAAAVVRFWANTVASGTLLATVSLAANESAGDTYDGRGLIAAGGIAVEIVSGAVEGTFWYA